MDQVSASHNQPLPVEARATAEIEALRRARMGDIRAVEQLISMHERMIFNYAHKRLNRTQDAEDLTQEVFRRFVSHVHLLDGNKPVRPWLTTVARNLVVDFLRKPATMEMDPELDVRDSADVARRAELRLDMEQAIQSLSPIAQKIVTLHFFEGYDYHEISQHLRISLSSVKVNVYRAKARLRSSLAGYA